jgi:hypothetical protein
MEFNWKTWPFLKHTSQLSALRTLFGASSSMAFSCALNCVFPSDCLFPLRIIFQIVKYIYVPNIKNPTKYIDKLITGLYLVGISALSYGDCKK